MKDEDLELLLETLKSIEIKLDNIDGRIKEFDESNETRNQQIGKALHQLRMSIDKDYREDIESLKSAARLAEDFLDEDGVSSKEKKHEDLSVKKIIEEGYHLNKEIDHFEYLRCLEEGEDTTWYIDRWEKGIPGIDDQDEIPETEEEIIKELHYKDDN